MQTQSKYEEMILKELREIPTVSQPQIIKILRSLRKSINAVKKIPTEKYSESGLCGIWVDDRNAEEIINDIQAHRTGFGGRGVEL
jgi:hypothetical protein